MTLKLDCIFNYGSGEERELPGLQISERYDNLSGITKVSRFLDG